MTSETPEPKSNVLSENAGNDVPASPSLPPLPPPPVPPPLLPLDNLPPKKVPVWLKVLLPLVGAGDVFLLATLLKMRGGGTASDVRNASYCIGHVLGNMIFVPLLVVALFYISKRFRNTRSQLLVLFVVWIFVGLSTFGQIGKLVQQNHEDFRTNATKVLELAQKMQRSDNLNETAKMGEEMGNMFQNMEEMDELRKLREWHAYENSIQDYQNTAARLFQAEDNWFVTATASKENLDIYIKKLNTIREKHAERNELYLRFQAKTIELREKGTSFSQRQFFKEYTQAAEKHNAEMKEMSVAETGTLVKLTEMLTILRNEWGKWSSDQEGTIIFVDETASEKYKTSREELEAFGARHNAAQKKMISEAHQQLSQF